MCYYICMPDEVRKVVPAAEIPSWETEGLLENGETSPDLFVAATEGAQQQGAVEEQPPVVPSVEQVPNNVVELRPQKDPLFEAVEKVLEKDLKPLYDAMPSSKKELFRVRGERATQKIRDAVAAGKLNKYRTMKVLREWLNTIPQVNKYWIGQEVKNRADDLVDLEEKEQRKAA